MEIRRDELLSELNFASYGLDASGGLEQSNTFVFTDCKVITFNDEIYTEAASQLGELNIAVIGKDLLELLNRIPDENITIETKDGNELRIKAKRKSAGISAFKEIQLPYKEIPKPKKWAVLADDCAARLKKAATIGSTDPANGIFAYIHVTPKRIEACDNQRLVQINGDTGFSDEILLPVSSMLRIAGLPLKKVAVNDGWAFFGIGPKQIIAVRCSNDEYQSLDKVMKVDGIKITLPNNLSQIIRRAEVFKDEAQQVEIKIEDNTLTLISRKETGWYKERKTVSYKGEPIFFIINPDFLLYILEHSPTVTVEPNEKIRMETKDTTFVAVLPIRAE